MNLIKLDRYFLLKTKIEESIFNIFETSYNYNILKDLDNGEGGI